MFNCENVNSIFNKWLDILRLKNNWDIKLELIDGHYNVDSPEYNTICTQFMTMLEQTVEELTKCFLLQYGNNKDYHTEDVRQCNLLMNYMMDLKL